MSEGLVMLESMVGAALAIEPLPTADRIRQLIATLQSTPLFSDVTVSDAEQLARLMEERHGVTMRIGTMLRGPDYEPWLEATRVDIDPYYWSRYRRLLAERGFSGHVLAMLDTVTDRILGLLENPRKAGPWDRRGMVVGHVQSGKTANYAGLICKAADAGYRLIVVIAGVHNNLRNQTQLRIDEGFVGRDSARLLSNRHEQFIGVGRFDRTRRPVTFTTSMRDFSKQLATAVGVPLQNLNEPALFVIKKNSSTLRNLLDWLREHSARSGTVDAPMLLIDDEADNASINTKHGKGEVTRINGHIRDLLHMFERSCYVGYTATPFANIFIDPDSDDEMRGADLFPKDFIVSLDPPSNYFGAGRVFLRDSEAVIRHIDDNEDLLPLRHPIDTRITALPHSLHAAIRTFIVARAIRLARGHGHPHCSMLVNASRFTEVQRQLRNEIHEVLETMRASIRINGALAPAAALRDPELAALHSAWSDEYQPSTEFAWPIVQEHLHEAVAPVTVVEINSRSSGTLNYSDYEKTGLNVIAVGGFSLSRGLTLEGLVVSYFLRNSVMYDTLMQMGRWFGYRPGYEDLCRVWMPEEAEGWYAHIADSIEELREELRIMEAANATPEQFGLKVRSHPDALIVTARNKMGSGERLTVSIGLGNRFVETSILRRDELSLETNRQAVQRMADGLSAAGVAVTAATHVTGGWLVRAAPVRPVLDFISAFQNHSGSLLTDPRPLRRYIEERSGTELLLWDVLFADVKGPVPGGLPDDSLGIPILCQRRSAGTKSDAGTLWVTNKQRVASRGVERTGLTHAQIAEAERKYREKHSADAAKARPNYPDRIYRAERDYPLLIVHLLAIGADGDDLSGQRPVVAYSISFPETGTEEKRVEYVVNTTWLRENYPDDLAGDEMAGDDDG
jgi:hypothetical protein